MEKLAVVVTARGAEKRWREQIPIQGKGRGRFQIQQVVTMPDAGKRCGKRERGLRCSVVLPVTWPMRILGGIFAIEWQGNTTWDSH